MFPTPGTFLGDSCGVFGRKSGDKRGAPGRLKDVMFPSWRAPGVLIPLRSPLALVGDLPPSRAKAKASYLMSLVGSRGGNLTPSHSQFRVGGGGEGGRMG